VNPVLKRSLITLAVIVVVIIVLAIAGTVFPAAHAQDHSLKLVS